MKLLVILLCLFSERFLVHTFSYQRFFWFDNYYQHIKKFAEKHSFFANPWALLALIIVPLIVAVAVVYCLLNDLFFGFVGLLLSIALFFYALGPVNVFYPITQSDSKNTNELVGDYFSQVNSQLFTVVFWYIIAGPIAAIAYRLVALCREISTVAQQAEKVADVLEWIPARLTALLFLLVGNFQRGLKLFISYLLAKPEFNNQMLRECGLQAVKTDNSEDVPMLAAESLVEHAIIVMFVLIALFTLISWL